MRRVVYLVLLLGAPVLASDEAVAELRQQVAAQQRQIEQLQSEIAEQRRLLESVLQARHPDGDGNGAAAEAQALAPSSRPAERQQSPLFFRIGRAEFTPGGFLDFTSVYRSTNVGSGIGTSFGSIPFHNTPAGRLSESRFSAQNSRVSLRVTANPGKQRVTGYVEADFLGALPANAFVSSNSNSLRMRLYWVNVQRGKWEVLGGQSWSMLTPNRVGLSAVPSDLFYSQDMDTNYQVGLTWARDPQFRVVYHANRNWTAGVSLENPEQYAGGGVVLPSSFYSSQVDNGTNTAAPNPHPDVVAKVAFDGLAGSRAVHVEAAGLVRGFRTVNPALGDSHVHGYGGSLNGNVELVKNFRLFVTSYLSQGGGRYIFGLGPDVIVRPDGSLSPVHAMSGVAGFEHQVNPSAMWYAYYGGAYFRRNFSQVAPGQFVGFGFPGSQNANRSLQEATLGYVHTFWKNPNFGALQLITQYSYLTRSPWAVPAGTPGHARSHMVWGDLRFVLP